MPKLESLSEKRLKIAQRVAVLLILAGFFLTFWNGLLIDGLFYCPTTPNIGTGNIIPYEIKHRTVYITSQDQAVFFRQTIFNIATYGAAGVLIFLNRGRLKAKLG